MADTFTEERLAWLETVNADPQASFGSKSAALAIALRLNRKSGEAFPSQVTLARMMGCKERTAHNAVKELCKLGYLEKRRGGFSKPNYYRITYPAHSPVKPCGNGDTTSPVNPCGNEAASPAPFDVSVPHDLTYQSCKTVRPNPLIEPFEKEPFELDISPPSPSCAKPAKAKGREDDTRFEEFYRAYPKKASKGRARKAWVKAVKLATPETIIAGAMRYAAERTGQDSTYTRHPATWLNDEAWNDEAAPPRPPSGSAGRAGTSAKDRLAAAVDAVLAQVGGADEL